MNEPLAYLNGWIPASQALVPVYDAGFVLGATVSEQLRTFAGGLFRLEAHLERLGRSLQTVGIEPGLSLDELGGLAQQLVDANHRLLAEGDDLGVSVFITPGPYATLAPSDSPRPTIGLHSYPLPFALWAAKYCAGESLVDVAVRQVPQECWPADLKCRSRMHYYLAERQAQQQQPAARALLLDSRGMVCETSTSNVIIFRVGEGLISPRRETILPGISLDTVETLAEEAGIRFTERDLTPEDIASADEVLLASTPSCLLPVTRFRGVPISSGQPGELFRRLLASWSQLVEVDIARQAERFAQRQA